MPERDPEKAYGPIVVTRESCLNILSLISNLELLAIGTDPITLEKIEPNIRISQLLHYHDINGFPHLVTEGEKNASSFTSTAA